MRRLASYVVATIALLLGALGLLLATTGLFTFFGLILGLLGAAFAVLVQAGRIRRLALVLNGLAVGVAVALLAVFFLIY